MGCNSSCRLFLLYLERDYISKYKLCRPQIQVMDYGLYIRKIYSVSEVVKGS